MKKKHYSDDPALNRAFKAFFNPGPEHNLLMDGFLIKHTGFFLADVVKNFVDKPYSYSMIKMCRIDNRRKTDLKDGEYVFTYTLTSTDIADEPMSDDLGEIYNGYAKYYLSWPGIALILKLKETDESVTFTMISRMKSYQRDITKVITGKQYHKYLIIKDHHAGIGPCSEGNDGCAGGMSSNYKFPSQLDE